jgi:hypothetical protein
VSHTLRTLRGLDSGALIGAGINDVFLMAVLRD